MLRINVGFALISGVFTVLLAQASFGAEKKYHSYSNIYTGFFEMIVDEFIDAIPGFLLLLLAGISLVFGFLLLLVPSLKSEFYLAKDLKRQKSTAQP